MLKKEIKRVIDLLTKKITKKALNLISCSYLSDIPKVQPKLYTPGPLLVSAKVREAMNFDYGSRDPEFLKIIQIIRNDLLELALVNATEYQAILVQGSGTFGVEATIGCGIPKNNHHLLVIINGIYGERIANIAQILDIKHSILRYMDNQVVNPEDVREFLQKNKDITHVAIVHVETATGNLEYNLLNNIEYKGLINPIKEVGAIIKSYNKKIDYIIDAMSSFGAYSIPVKEWNIDYIISSSNKCLQGTPGFCFVIANKEKLLKTKDNARSLALDLYDQWKGLESNLQFRFTPPTHVIKAFSVALEELKLNGGTKSRFERYSLNQKILAEGMSKLGFRQYINSKYQSCIITTFIQPDDPNFDYEEMYNMLAKHNLLIYPGKLKNKSTFRIGSIGELYPNDMHLLVREIEAYLKAKNIHIPIPYNDNHN